MKERKLTICKSCGTKIAKNAKVCPHCGAKNKELIYKRVWLIILIIIFLLTI